jgi:hypothetical protein
MRTLRALGIWRTAACALLLAAAACDRDAASPDDPSIAGHWSGSAYLGAVDFQATFTQDGEVVGGTGEFSSPDGGGPFTISGTLRGRDLQLTLASAQYGITTFSGRFTGANTIEGELSNPDLDLTLERD